MVRKTFLRFAEIAVFGTIALGASGCGVTAAPGPAVAVPDDEKDDAAGLQAQIDAAAARGGGVVTLKAGRYDTGKPLILRSHVTLAGDPAGTTISNAKLVSADQWGGTVMFAGNMNPGSYEDNGGIGYAGRPVTLVGSTELKLSDCQDAKPPVGAFIWIGTVAGAAETGGNFRPDAGEVTLVSATGECSVSTADALRLPSDQPLKLYWADGSRHIPAGSPVANVPIVEGGLRDLQFESEHGQAIVESGCYHCRFENIRILGSRRLIMLEGARGTVYDHVSGVFSERGIEFAMYATDNVVSNVDAEYRGKVMLNPRPAIRFGESARRNMVEAVTLRLGSAYVGKRDKIRLDESADNTLSNVSLLTATSDGLAPVFASRPNATAKMTNVKVCVQTATNRCK